MHSGSGKNRQHARPAHLAFALLQGLQFLPFGVHDIFLIGQVALRFRFGLLFLAELALELLQSLARLLRTENETRELTQNTEAAADSRQPITEQEIDTKRTTLMV